MSNRPIPTVRGLHAQDRDWLLPTIAAALIAATCGGCGSPPPAQPDGSATGTSPAATTSAQSGTEVTSPTTTDDDVAAAPQSAEEEAAPDAAAVNWRPSEELAARLTEQPEAIGDYELRVPAGFHALVRGTDAQSAQPSQLYVFESPAGDGAATSVVSATVHTRDQNTRSGDEMLSAFFANMGARLPDFQRGETEHGLIDGLKTSRATYEAAPPLGPPIQGVVYFVDNGDDVVVLQGVYKEGTPDCNLELLDASLQSFQRRASQEER